MNQINVMNAQQASGVSLDAAIRRTVRIVAFIFFTALGAQLAARLPYTPVPVTMQTLFVVLAGIVLGPRDGFYAMCGYLGMGLAGAPVFAGLTFGPAVLFGPTGGYLLAFPAAALVSGRISTMARGSTAVLTVAVLTGKVLILASGGLYLSLVTSLPLPGTLALAVTPFIAGETFKAALAVIIAKKR
ncbi:MAG TPA: biotin transporter BioY [Candidatus Krumholzibacterium sp.]|nr:biotin transporter BioY [Candidatus Krumholzibacterium sp.]